MSLTTVLLFALLIGVVCGLRSMTGPAVVAWGAHLGWLQLYHSKLAFFHSVISLVIFTLLALGELVADKLPKIPGRNQPGPLAVRFISGALCGAALCVSAGGAVWAGAMLAGIGGVAGGLGGYYARRWLTTTRGLPDFPVAIIEDLIAVGGGLFIVSRFLSAVTEVLHYANPS